MHQQPIITFSDDVDRDSISNVLNLFAGRRVIVTCSNSTQITGEIKSCLHTNGESLHLHVWDERREELTNWVHIAIDTIEEVTYL